MSSLPKKFKHFIIPDYIILIEGNMRVEYDLWGKNVLVEWDNFSWRYLFIYYFFARG